MIEIILVTVALAVIAFGIGVVVYYKKSVKKHQTDYYALFMMGIIFTPAGIAIMIAARNIFPAGSPLFGLGIVYLIAGLAHRKEWKDSPSYKRRLFK